MTSAANKADDKIARSVTHAMFTIERVYDASPARVFRAFSDADAHHRWFVAEEGWDVIEYNHDFRVGGREGGRFSQDGKVFYHNDTLYQDIVPDNRIVFAYTMDQDDKRISASVATVELKPEGDGKTRLKFTEQGAFLDGFDKAEFREEGWQGLLERLAVEITEHA
ncbi:SRPBCC family protein [Thalassospira xiamenensis]|uniref:Uncharacterized conserved protein YndB, AHSA1/START domain n=1 Tax=Thalassospira xiamenensis TaxID=220697 RepID=A0A285RJP7_9PROT|nr:SRPBCC family protein [Thalassospira xiamenensis]SOB93938.1 Uncharacterized conserved protein YndB, AHSA1/START domain [Thalassospira xiamenensis]